MPRSYGTTNVMPYTTPPPVGLAGDEYYNPSTHQLFLSDGTSWNVITGGGGGGSGLLSVVTLPVLTAAGSPYTVAHNLNTANVFVQLWDAVTHVQVIAQVQVVDANNVRVSVTQSSPNGVTVVTSGTPAGSGQTYSLSFAQTLTAPTVAGSPYTVTHSLNTTNVFVQIWDSVTLQLVQAQVRVVDVNDITISVAQNMPNNVNVVVLGVGNAPVPANPTNYATKQYVDAKTATLPAPVTSGSGVQSYTDPLGDVWVAANGVRGGNWYRARDVMHARYYRTAAWTCNAGGWLNVNLDTLQFDDYGLYSTGSGLFTPPLTGFWRLTFFSGSLATATGQWSQLGIWESSGTVVSNSLLQSSMAQALQTGITTVRRITSLTDTYYTRVAASTAQVGQTGAANTYLEMDYLGTG